MIEIGSNYNAYRSSGFDDSDNGSIRETDSNKMDGVTNLEVGRATRETTTSLLSRVYSQTSLTEAIRNPETTLEEVGRATRETTTSLLSRVYSKASLTEDFKSLRME